MTTSFEPAAAGGPGDTSLHVRRAIANDRASVAWIVARFTPLLACQARQRMPSSLRRFCDPEDVVADVWMAVLAILPTLKPADGSSSRGLLKLAGVILVRRLRDLVEKHVVGKPVAASAAEAPIDELPAETRGVVAQVIAEERRGRVRACFDALAPDDREIVILRGVENRPHAHIGARLGISPENAAVRYHRALKRLRTLVPASVFDDLDDD